MKKGKSHFRLPSDGQPVIQALQAGPLLSSVPVRTGKYRHAPAVQEAVTITVIIRPVQPVRQPGQVPYLPA